MLFRLATFLWCTKPQRAAFINYFEKFSAEYDEIQKRNQLALQKEDNNNNSKTDTSKTAPTASTKRQKNDKNEKDAKVKPTVSITIDTGEDKKEDKLKVWF